MKNSITFFLRSFSAATLFLVLAFPVRSAESPFVLAAPARQAAVYLAAEEPECVRLAVADLVGDVKKITGIELKMTEQIPADGPVLIVATAGVPASDRAVRETGLEIPDGFSTRWECFRIEKTGENRLVIYGSDERGTMFGVYDFLEKQLGVDPFYFWTDREPKKRPEISFNRLSVTSKEPTFRYRGWFINDEDLLTEWKNGGGDRHIKYPYYSQVVHPDVMDRVVEALVRNKFNLIIPASFIDIVNPPEEELVKRSARRGVFLSQHHVEPLGVSAFGYFNYWKAKDGTKPLFSFYSNRDKLVEVWNHYAERWAKYPNVIWQVGLRGIADRPMWLADPGVPQSDAERGRIISEAIAVQREIVRKYDRRENPPMTATLWAEGSEFYHQGFLTLPEEVIIVFSDNSPGWKFQNDFYSIQRKKGKRYGVYYHHQLWTSGPHLAQGISPARTWTVFKETIEFPANDYAILNVSNVREFVLGLAGSGKHLYDFENFDPHRFTDEWVKERYPSKPEEVRALYEAYFSAFVLHPERKIPVLLDGQTRLRGLRILDLIRTYVKDNAKFRSQKVQSSSTPFEIVRHSDEPLRPPLEKDRNDGKSTKIDMGLSDAHPALSSPETILKAAEAILKAAEAQRKSFARIVDRAEALLPDLTPEERNLLKTNLIAHAEIMADLSGWYENVVLARLVLAFGHEEAAAEHLRRALQYLERIDKAKERLCQGEKWEHWYRGEKKMNLDNLKNSTEKTLELIRNRGGAVVNSTPPPLRR